MLIIVIRGKARSRNLKSDIGSTELAQYAYLGLSGVAEVNHPQPELVYPLIDPSGSTDPDTGDIYSGLDRFGRIKDCRWLLATGPTDVARFKYGYDRASNRLWRQDTVAVSQSKDFDELYAYDGLYRLAGMQRGRLNGGHTAMSTLTFEQCWTLDETEDEKGTFYFSPCPPPGPPAMLREWSRTRALLQMVRPRIARMSIESAVDLHIHPRPSASSAVLSSRWHGNPTLCRPFRARQWNSTQTQGGAARLSPLRSALG